MNRALTIIFAAAAALVATTSSARMMAAPTLDRTAWEIMAINGKRTLRMPRLEFVRGQALGTSGCNAFDGTYTQQGEMLSFRRIIATQMACGGELGAQERALFALLGPSVRLRRDANGGLFLQSGKRTAALRRAAECINCNKPPVPAALPLPKLDGREWFIMSINGKPLSKPDAAKISFSATALSATVGCNSMNGPYKIGKQAYLVTGQMLSTLISSPPGVAEEEGTLNKLLHDDPLIQAVRGPRDTIELHLSSGQNRAVLGQLWYVGLE
jgi:heat shock protein HslJ